MMARNASVPTDNLIAGVDPATRGLYSLEMIITNYNPEASEYLHLQ